MKRCGIPAVLLVCVLIGAVWVLSGNQPSAGQSPDEWRQLSLSDFVREITRLTSAAEPPSDALWTEIRSQSAERLLQVVAQGTAADYGDLVSLYLWGRPALTAEQTTTVLAGLQPRANQVSGWAFEQLRSVHARMSSAQMPAATTHSLALAWLEGREVRTLEDADQLGWLLGEVQASAQTQDAPRELSVQWTGAIQAPADGEYVLSISPINLDFKQGGAFRRQTMSIWVAEQQVLDSTTAGWTCRARSVRLAAAQWTPLRVEFSYACSEPAVFADRPAVALLWWEGPGMSQRVVPASALASAEGQPPGLAGQYTLRGASGEESQRRVDPQINFIWSDGRAALSADERLQTQLADQLHKVASDQSTLSAWESAGKAQQEDWVGGSRSFLESLSAAQRKTWAETLLAHPALLADCPRAAAANLYHHCRLGSPHAGLQVWGTWAQAHADEGPTLGADFDETNRRPYRRLGGGMVWEYPAHLAQLEEDYLTRADGSCSLPTAYALAYGYWAQGQIGRWIETLDARLADEQLSGDRRVGWLLARAQAEEIRRSPPGRYWRTMERYLAGQGWIEEATLVAASEAVRLRAFLELAARWTADQRLAAAGQMLDRAGKRCTSAASSATLQAWRSGLVTLDAALQDRHQQAEAEAREAYIARLQQRHRAAASRGDTEATTHYKQLLDAAGVTE